MSNRSMKSLLRLQSLEFGSGNGTPEDGMIRTDQLHEIERLRGQLEPAVLRQYDSRKRRYSGTSVVPVKSGVCSGCHLTLSVKTRRAAYDGTTLCEHCARMVFQPSKRKRPPQVVEFDAA